MMAYKPQHCPVVNAENRAEVKAMLEQRQRSRHDVVFVIPNIDNLNQPIFILTALVEKDSLTQESEFKNAVGRALTRFIEEWSEENRKHIKENGYTFLDLIDDDTINDPRFKELLEEEGILDFEHEGPIVSGRDWEAGDSLIEIKEP